MLKSRKKLGLIVIIFLIIFFLKMYDFSKGHKNIVSLHTNSDKNLSTIIPYSEKFKNLPAKYFPITGKQYKSYFLHYCFPGFLPIAESDCKREFVAGRDPGVVQVNFEYSLLDDDGEYVFLEAAPRGIAYPFPVNVDIEGKTPYFAEYKKRIELAKKEKLYPLIKDIEFNMYEGLICYKSKITFDNSRRCVPEDYLKYKTKIGNPPIFICSAPMCMVVLDQANGWVVRAIFNIDALKNWKDFYINLNDSIDTIMEK